LGTGGVDRLAVTANGNVGINTVTPSTYAGYSGISTNNATNGGFIDFNRAGIPQAVVSGDVNGLNLFASIGSVHLWSGGTEKMTITSNGNIGVGATTPVAKMHINGTLLMETSFANIDPTGSIGNLSYLANSGQMLMGWNRSAGGGESDFISNQGPGATGGFAFFNYDNSNNQKELMSIRGTGQVLIGVSNAIYAANQPIGSNMLAVGGGIESESVTVKVQGSWPDYVFKPAYSLPELSKVKSYIDENHHLPEIPSETEIEKDGQNLGEMNKVLVKKVEELTLYTIEADKQLTAEKQKNNDQEARIKKLEAEVRLLLDKQR